MEPAVAPKATSGGAQPGRHAHLVELYDSDDFLVHSVCGFLGPALGAGDAVVVVATKAHRKKFLAELHGRGFDLQAARAQRQLVELDAAETLARFMVDGRPDASRFVQVLQPILAQAEADGRSVRAYGEMVALLWSDGNAEAAIALEGLWNDLAVSHPFSLLCAYPLEVVARESSTVPFKRMCRQHTRVVPTQSYSKLADPDDQLYALALLQQEAAAGLAEAAALRAQQGQLVAAAREVAAARDEAQAATRAKSEFLIGMSREMRAPAETLLSHVGLLLEGPLSQDQRATLEEVRTAGQALLRITDDIVDYSRLEAEDLQLDVGQLDLRQLVEAVAELMAAPARARRLELLTQCDPAIPLARRGDTLRLRQVLVNLVSNAVKLNEEGQVTIGVRPASGDQVRFEVVEDGTCVAPARRERLFKELRQASPSADPLAGGMGLGVSVARGLVEAMGGRIGAETTSGRGSTCWFTVPLPVDWFAMAPPGATDGKP